MALSKFENEEFVLKDCLVRLICRKVVTISVIQNVSLENAYRIYKERRMSESFKRYDIDRRRSDILSSAFTLRENIMKNNRKSQS